MAQIPLNIGAWGGVGRAIVRPPSPPKPPGIGGARGATLSRPQSTGVGTAGSGITSIAGLTGTPAPSSGVGTAGSGIAGLTGAPVHSPGTHPVTSTVTPPPPDLSGSKWMGYLSPDQLNALNQAGYQFTQQSGDWQARISNANTDYNTTLADAQHNHDVQQAQAVEEMAARGLAVSGIQASDLTDINRALAERQAMASQTLNTLVGEATRAITALNNSWGSTQIAYEGLAAANAANSPAQQPYDVTTQVPNAPAPTPGSPAARGAPPAPAQPRNTIMGAAEHGHPNWFPGIAARSGGRGRR